MLQHGAYTLLIDACYDREIFPTLDEAIEWTWSSTEAEIEAVKFVLARFFKLDSEGRYIQDRILSELLEYHEKADKNKQIAIERETKRRTFNTKRDDDSTKRAPVVHETPPNQEPLTKNHKPRTKNQEPREGTASPPPSNLDLTAWQKWLDYRSKVKKPIKPASIEAAQVALAGHGLDQLAVVDQSIANGWQGLFPLKHATQPGAPPKSFAQQEREQGMRRWEEMTGEVHPDRHAGAIDVPANFLNLEALPND